MPAARTGSIVKHWHETATILDQVGKLGASGARAAIATVVRISGSAYRRPGAKLLVDERGATTGGVSGGCLESDVRAVALEILAGAPARLLHYDTGSDEEMVWGLGLGCQGAVDVYVAPADPAGCAGLRALMAARAPVAIVTLLPAGPSLAFAQGALAGSSGSIELDRELSRRAATLLEQGHSRLEEIAGQGVFFDSLRPPPQLVIFGAGEDARPLSALAAVAGFEVTVVDHRPAYLTEARFPKPARLILRRPSEGVADLRLGSGQFAVVQMHALIHDRDWLRALLPLPLAYLGLLGPKSRSEDIVQQLGAAPPAHLYAPVGLDLGADGPEQVAVSIVAELLAVHAGRAPNHLKLRTRGIHE